MKFSVLMSVYKNEKPENFVEAMDSVLTQTLMPDEIVLMRDGPVPGEMQSVINRYLNGEFGSVFSYYPMEQNQGLGNALKLGVEKAKYDYIARMDTDDIAEPNRFELQTSFMEEHPEISVCGGQIYEFIGSRDNIAGKREVPLMHDEIADFMKNRNPFSHMTVMFKRQDVLAAGNYIEMHLVEDYYLWCRMLIKGYKFANLPEILVYARTDENMYQRRGGYKYFLSWKAIEKFKLENGITKRPEYMKTLTMRFCVQVLTPNKVRGIILKKFARK